LHYVKSSVTIVNSSTEFESLKLKTLTTIAKAPTKIEVSRVELEDHGDVFLLEFDKTKILMRPSIVDIFASCIREKLNNLEDFTGTIIELHGDPIV
jgi:hypothetical protein